MNVTEVGSEFHVGTTERTESVRLGEYTVGVISDKLHLQMVISKEGKQCWNMLLSPSMVEIIRSELILAHFDGKYHHKIMLGKASLMDDSCYYMEIKRDNYKISIIFSDVAYRPTEWCTEVIYYQTGDLIHALLNAINYNKQQKMRE